MKVYNLSCGHHHRFEGWFSSEEDFNAQLETAAIGCPVCDNRAITRLPSAPHLSLSSSPQMETPDAGAAARAKMLELMRQIVTHTEDVGERFAEEARRMHYKERDECAIRGIATRQEVEELSDEGIEVVLLPLPAMAKKPLQ
jgi:hypothetical protein